MLEKIKEIPFVDESSAVKVMSEQGKVILERSDKVVWAQETTTIPAEGVNCYVEADKFFTLLPDIKEVKQTTCLEVYLKNGGRYELPFLNVSWEQVVMPEEYSNTITFKLSDLMLCTLKNLVKPELQCVYIDEQGAVTCDFVSACISKEVKANKPFLLPPDVQALVDGRLCKVEVTDEKIYIKANDFSIATTKPTMSEDAWWEGLRQMVSETDGAFAFADATKLPDALKRLSMFSNTLSFNGTQVVAGENFEPFMFSAMPENEYEIERTAKILSTANKISVSTGNLILKNEHSMFLISPIEVA